MNNDAINKLNRRKFLGASAAGAASVVGLAACGNGSRAASAVAPSAGSGLADAVFDAFKTHRLVGIGETHGLQNHHDVLDLLLTDPRLPNIVDDIVIEFGNALYQDTIDRFIKGESVDNVDLRRVWRDTTQSPLMTFDQPVYEQFFRTVRAVNWTRPPDKQIRVLRQAGIDGDSETRASRPRDWRISRDAQSEEVSGGAG